MTRLLVQDHVGASFGERRRNAKAKTGGRAGHDGGFTRDGHWGGTLRIVRLAAWHAPGDKIRHLFRFDSVALAHFIGSNAGQFASLDRIQNGRRG
jgi:hypothetical protein